MGEVVVWLGTHNAWDLAFRIGNRSHHSIVGHYEQSAILSYFLDYHAIAVGPGPAPLEQVLSLCAGGGLVYNDGGVLNHSTEYSKKCYINILSKLFRIRQYHWAL